MLSQTAVQALRAAIQTAGLSGEPGEVAAQLNAPRATGQTEAVRVSRRDAKGLLIQRGKLLGILEADAPAAKIARYILVDPDYAEIDFSDPKATALLAQLVAANLLTGEDVAAVTSLGTRPVLRPLAVSAVGHEVTQAMVEQCQEGQ